MRTVKGTAFTTLGIVAAIVAVGCGDTIGTCENVKQELFWMLLAFLLMGLAVVFFALGVNAENERADAERLKKLNRVPTHSNEWRDAQ